MISQDQKFENMRKQYKYTQELLKQAIQVLESYDGSRAIDQWDETIPASRDWETKARKMVNVYKHKRSGNIHD